jgi:hypothetical protein
LLLPLLKLPQLLDDVCRQRRRHRLEQMTSSGGDAGQVR